ncbi:carboxypeptidase regulatory-like domain-containing protein, partial [Patescibacteria group bacterium]|nr:carboxypeptidase regulatory-like domain-containing protein [Patescibacteria group bacterium]
SPGGGNTTLTDYSTTANATSTVSNATGVVSAGAGIDFSLGTASQRIVGYVVDASNNPIPNAEIWGYKPGGMGMGSHTMSANDGSFSLKAATGMYKIGASKPGMPFAPEKKVEVFAHSSQSGGSSDGNTDADVLYEGVLIVDTTGVFSTASNPLVIRIKKSSYTISGRVADSSGNVIAGAAVWAFQQNAPGNSNTVTGSEGTYTLYVPSLGTWTVEADAPGYGYLGSRSVVLSVADSTPSGQNFSPSLTIVEISGLVSGMSDNSGVNIWADKSDNTYFNNSFTDSSGNFTIRLQYSDSVSSSYDIGAWSPESGDIGKNTIVLNTSGAITSGTTTFAIAGLNTITINSQNSAGSALTVSQMFVDFFDSTNYFGKHIDIENANSGTASLPNGTYEVHVYSPGFTPSDLTITGAGIATSTGIAVLTVDGAEEVNIKLPATGGANLRTVSGTVTAGGSNVGDAWVWMDKLSGSGGSFTGVHMDTSTASNGTYSISLPDGYYMMGVDKPGYTGPNPTEIQISADSSGNNYALTSNNLTISGYIFIDANSNSTYDSGEGVENAWVFGEKLGGGWAGIQTEPDGSYSLSVSAGEWSVRASSERYQEASYVSNPISSTASPTGVNIQLTQTQTVFEQNSKPMTPANGGTFDDKANSGVKIVMPPNALGNDTNSSQVTVQTKNSVPRTATRAPLGGQGKSILATDNSGRAVTNLSSSITIEIDVTKSDIDTAVAAGDHAFSDIANITNGYWDDTKNNWVDITTTKTVLADGASVGFATFASNIASNSETYADYTVTLKSTTDHLSDFAPLVPTNASAPATPTGLAATPSTSGTPTVVLDWTANSEGDLSGYFVYRSINNGSTYPLLADAGNVLTYSDSSGLFANSTYYYKISAYDTESNESSASSAVSATPLPGAAASSGASGDTTAPTISDVEVVAGDTEATITWTTNESSVSWIVFGTTTNYGQEEKVVSYITSHSMILDNLLTETVYHYQIKSKDTFGNARTDNDRTFTTLALGEEAEAVVAEGEEAETAADEDVGTDEGTAIPISEMTTEQLEAKISEIIGKIAELKAAIAQVQGQVVITGIPADFNFARNLEIKMAGDDVKYLQILLNSYSDTRVAETGVGSSGYETTYFGSLTKVAVIKFQEKYSFETLAPWGLTRGTGYVGSTTRAKLNSLLGK